MSRQHQPSPSELGFGRLFEQIRDAVVVSDQRGRIIAWNPSAERMFGHSARDVIGSDVNLIVPARLRARHDEGMRRFRETGHGALVDGGAILELPALRADGSEITIELRLSRIEAGDATLVMAIVRDVTERVRLAAAVEEDRARLRDANDALEAFSYVVGHDLKEPVRGVHAYLEMLSEHVDTAQGRDDLLRAQEANRRVYDLLAGLLEWSRAAMGDVELKPIRVDAVLNGPACRGRYHRAMDERHARLALEGEFLPVVGTEPLACQVFGNLVLNAIRHNPRPDPLVRVVAGAPEGGYLPLVVRDNGPGFPEAVRARFADRKARRAPSAASGFGLAIAARAAETMGGRLEIPSPPTGEGGEVRVWLPLAQEGSQSSAMPP